MTQKKLPTDALAYYMSLGPSRSHKAVAKHFGVCKRTVTATAVREKWKEAVEQADSKVREKASEQYVETLEQMNDRHLKVLKFIELRAIETIRSLPLASAMDAVRAYALAFEKERLIRGEPSERVNIEEIIKRETKNWVVPEDEASEGAAVR